ncbi:MAG TPA: hypothetical protein IGS17_00550 [Oscillatoriales cyanobacterium M59_W2019_021]|nr:hypothetical protein [Oscillatoriales cyanobacterium M59_W2019_021]
MTLNTSAITAFFTGHRQIGSDLAKIGLSQLIDRSISESPNLFRVWRSG